MHLEEYLETDHTVHLNIAEDPGSEIRESPVYDPQVKQVKTTKHVGTPSHQAGGADFSRQQESDFKMHSTNNHTNVLSQDNLFNTEVRTPSTSCYVDEFYGLYTSNIHATFYRTPHSFTIKPNFYEPFKP
jgi:hypothetical protein